MSMTGEKLSLSGFAMLVICVGALPAIAAGNLSGRTIYTSCPLTFPETDNVGGIMKLSGVDVWWGFLGLQEPNPKSPDWDISGDGPWTLQCTYRGEERELTIDLPPQVTACWTKRDKQGQLSGYCTGPKAKEPVSPPPLYVAHKLDADAILHGFGLGRTMAEIETMAARQGAKATLESTDQGQVATVPFPPDETIEIVFSPEGMSRQVTWNMHRNSLDDNAAAVAVRQFGFFTKMERGHVRWDRHTGVILLVDTQDGGWPSQIRLIDQREASSGNAH